VTKRLRDADGRPIGTAHENPHLELESILWSSLTAIVKHCQRI
jgi:hypothetical protein